MLIGAINSAVTTSWFDGKIDEIAIWNEALNTSEIVSIYTMALLMMPELIRETILPLTNLKAYYKMESASGGTLKDLSGNGLNGVINEQLGLWGEKVHHIRAIQMHPPSSLLLLHPIMLRSRLP